MKTIDVKHDTRSGQKFTEEKLKTMTPSEIRSVASARGYDVDPVGKITIASFLKQQSESDAFAGDENHTESGQVPDDYEDPTIPNYRDVASTGASRHGSVGGLEPATPLGSPDAPAAPSEPSGEQSSAEDHSGTESNGATLGEVPKTAAPAL